MMNSKETLKNLHNRFPQLSLDELFDALDCYVEEYNFFAKPYTDNDIRIRNIQIPHKPLNPFYAGNTNTVTENSNIQLTASH